MSMMRRIVASLFLQLVTPMACMCSATPVLPPSFTVKVAWTENAERAGVFVPDRPDVATATGIVYQLANESQRTAYNTTTVHGDGTITKAKNDEICVKGIKYLHTCTATGNASWWARWGARKMVCSPCVEKPNASMVPCGTSYLNTQDWKPLGNNQWQDTVGSTIMVYTLSATTPTEIVRAVITSTDAAHVTTVVNETFGTWNAAPASPMFALPAAWGCFNPAPAPPTPTPPTPTPPTPTPPAPTPPASTPVLPSSFTVRVAWTEDGPSGHSTATGTVYQVEKESQRSAYKVSTDHGDGTTTIKQNDEICVNGMNYVHTCTATANATHMSKLVCSPCVEKPTKFRAPCGTSYLNTQDWKPLGNNQWQDTAGSTIMVYTLTDATPTEIVRAVITSTDATSNVTTIVNETFGMWEIAKPDKSNFALPAAWGCVTPAPTPPTPILPSSFTVTVAWVEDGPGTHGTATGTVYQVANESQRTAYSLSTQMEDGTLITAQNDEICTNGIKYIHSCHGTTGAVTCLPCQQAIVTSQDPCGTSYLNTKNWKSLGDNKWQDAARDSLQVYDVSTKTPVVIMRSIITTVDDITKEKTVVNETFADWKIVAPLPQIFVVPTLWKCKPPTPVPPAPAPAPTPPAPSPSPLPPPPPSPYSPTAHKSKYSTGEKIGAILVAAAVASLVTTLIFCCKRRITRKKNAALEDPLNRGVQ